MMPAIAACRAAPRRPAPWLSYRFPIFLRGIWRDAVPAKLACYSRRETEAPLRDENERLGVEVTRLGCRVRELEALVSRVAGELGKVLDAS